MAAVAPGPGPHRKDALPWLLLAATLAVYVVLYLALFDLLGVWASLLFVVPLTGAAVTRGLRGGLVLGVLSFPFNWTLAVLAGGALPTVRPEHVLMAGAGILVAASIGAIRDSNIRYRGLNAELASANARLTDALADVKTLSGLVPICAECGKMRSDKGYWLRIEDYMKGRSALQFSHGLCPDCVQRLYPGATGEKDTTPETGGATG